MAGMHTHYKKLPKHHPRGGKSASQAKEETRIRYAKKQARRKSRAARELDVALPIREKTTKTRRRKPLIFCTGCGFRVKSTWTYCGHCGMKLGRSLV
jgi:hypothetical protein